MLVSQAYSAILKLEKEPIIESNEWGNKTARTGRNFCAKISCLRMASLEMPRRRSSFTTNSTVSCLGETIDLDRSTRACLRMGLRVATIRLMHRADVNFWARLAFLRLQKQWERASMARTRLRGRSTSRARIRWRGREASATCESRRTAVIWGHSSSATSVSRSSQEAASVTARRAVTSERTAATMQ